LTDSAARKARQKIISDRYYRENAEKVRADNRKWKRSHPIEVFRQRVKQRAKAQSLDFNLDLEWFKERIERGVCEATGLPFVDSDKPMAPFTHSVDRTDPGKGYTKDNCKMVIWIYNAAKGSNSHEDVMIMARSLCIQS